MDKPKQHIFVCASFRAAGEPLGICNKKGSVSLAQYLQEGLSDRGMNEIAVSMTGCLKACERGPVMLVYPENYWYGKIETEAVIDEILDALEQGRAAEKYLIA